jgi:hypothetical protein
MRAVRRGSRRLAGARRGPRTTVVVPVPAAEEAVGRWRATHDRWAAKGVPAHVTVQGPFLPPERIDDRILTRVAAVLGRARARPFALAAVRRLPGVVYLAPASDEPFAHLTQLLAREWPELPRYGGGIRNVGRYHLTVARTFSPLAALAAVRAIRPFLPIVARPEEALLFAVEVDERVTLLGRFPIGHT